MDRGSSTQFASRLARGQTVVVEGAGRELVQNAASAGRALMLLSDVLGSLGHVPRALPSVLKQVAMSGFGSLFVLALIAGLTGMIMAVQTGAALEPFGATSQLGGIIAVTFCRELGPIWAAVIVLARVGAAIAAELGTMVVNEEVDALRCMSVDPVRYLVLPRFVGLIIAMPLLAALADAVGMAGGALVATTMFNQPLETYLDSARQFLVPLDFYSGLFKAAVFGAIIAIIACARGLGTRDGAEGVGRATTSSVVLNVIFVLLADLILTWAVQVIVKPVLG